MTCEPSQLAAHRCPAFRSPAHRLPQQMAVSRVSMSRAGRLAVGVTLLVLLTASGLCNADHTTSGRTPDEALELPPKLNTDRIENTQKQLEHWSQTTKDHLELPAERESAHKAEELKSSRKVVDEQHDKPSDVPINEAEHAPPAGKPQEEQIPKSASDSESPVPPDVPMGDTSIETIPRRKPIVDAQAKKIEQQEKHEKSSERKGSTPPRTQEESANESDNEPTVPLEPEQHFDNDGTAKAEADSTSKDDPEGQSAPETQESHSQGKLSASDKGDETDVQEESENEVHSNTEAEAPVESEDMDSSSGLDANDHKDPVKTAPDDRVEETVEEKGRRNYQKSLEIELEQARKAEESLIKDAVTHGNRAKQSGEDVQNEAGTAKQDAKTETAQEAETREMMKQAELYRAGSKDIKPDYSRAFSLCESAAEKGSAAGLNCMGEFYKHGLGRERDIEKAVQYFRHAAARGLAAAQRNLAFLYSSGHGVEQSSALAVLNLHFAAVSGDHQAQLAMGYRHMYGIGVPKNCQTAMEFYMPAAEFVVKEMHHNRGQPMIEKQALATDGVKSKSMDQDEDVVNYYAYSAERGDASAQVALGQLYFMGARGLAQDHGEAFRWYLRAAEQGDSHAMGHLGNMYAQGIYVDANNQTALSYFRRGVDKGNALALNGLGFMQMYGMGVTQSYEDAFKSFSKAAEQGNQEARFNLGALHVGGYGVPKDYARAIYYFTLAANRGHMLALYNLAMMHHNGFGTPRSCPNAVQFIKSVAERGEWAAQLQRGYRLYMAGDVDRALLVYSELMELGFDVAQANVAHVLDEERTGFTRGQRARALRAYELSAQQGNMAAELKIGDYYYHGWGTAVNYRKAVAHYRAASEARIAQAMFNLGWMHERGTGIARDRHLAKRFYDMAAEAAPEAVWPAGICLARLWLIGASEAALDWLDAASLALTLRLSKYGVRVPLSAVWLPVALQYWDVVLGAILLFWLVVVLAIRSHVVSARHNRL